MSLLSHMELLPSIGTYQTALLEYAFDAARHSVQVSDGVASTGVQGVKNHIACAKAAAAHRVLFERPPPKRHSSRCFCV